MVLPDTNPSPRLEGRSTCSDRQQEKKTPFCVWFQNHLCHRGNVDGLGRQREAEGLNWVSSQISRMPGGTRGRVSQQGPLKGAEKGISAH